MSLQSLFGIHGSDGVPDPQSVNVPIARGDLLELLQNDRRAWVLREVPARQDVTNVDHLSTARAAVEADSTPVDVGSQARKNVYVGLYQCHLPKLDEFGLVEYEQERGRICTTDATAEAVAALDVIDAMVDEDAAPERSPAPDDLVGAEGGGSA